MKRSKFSLSHYKLLTCDMGELIPVGLTEVLPGDSIQQASSMLVRVSPLVAPVMHPVVIKIHHWFVPHRIIWEDWEDFITGGPDGADASVLPYRTKSAANSPPGGLFDYLGIPPDVPEGFQFSALPHRGYQMIWNEWYRDQDLQPEVAVNLTSGLDASSVVLQRVSWEKDYFTSARPWTQKGPEVTVPMGVRAPVISAGNGQPRFNVNPGMVDSTLNSSSGAATVQWDSNATATGAATWHITALEADLTNAEAANINELRTAFALQRYAEARARYGSRYTEYLRYLGVKSSDARLQRPEYLGGGKQTIQFSEVLKTGAGEDPAEPIGTLKGHGIGAMRSNRYRRFFEEHGYIHSLMSVRPKTMYGHAVGRTFNRRTKEDFFQKELQHVGQQEILNKEVFGPHAAPDGIFGYQDRYDEYRRTESGLAGDFRSTLDYWHYARMFATDPVLNAAFVQCDATKRPNAIQTEDVLWCMVNHSIQARRMLDASGRSFIF